MSCETQNIAITYDVTQAKNVRFDISQALTATYKITQSQELECAALDPGLTSYYDTVVSPTLGAANIVSHYKLDETSGTTAADAAGTSNGTYENGVTLGAATLLASGSGAAANFDGVNDFVDLGVRSDLDFIHQTGVFTISAWVEWDGVSSFQGIIGSATASGDDGFQLRIDGGNAKVQGITNGSAVRVLSQTGTISAGTLHVVFTGDSADQFLYVNGAAAGSGTAAASGVASAIATTIGGLGGGTSFNFGARINEVTIASVTASPAQVTALYNGGI